MTVPHLAELSIFPAVAIGGTLIALVLTPTEISGLTIAAATLLGAILTGAALIITAIRSTRRVVDRSVAKIIENTELTQAVQVKVAEVAVKVDGQATQAQAQIALMQAELKWLRERIGEQRQDAAQLAQAKAIPAMTLPISATNVVNGPEDHLGDISKNTEEIKQNTKKKGVQE